MVLRRCGCQERLLPSFLHNHKDQFSALPADFKEGMGLLGSEKGRGEDEVIYEELEKLVVATVPLSELKIHARSAATLDRTGALIQPNYP